jgi:phosphomevalonate kinase
MMRVTASAPGKLVLAGEYAVLEGAPALVMAVDRRARVVLDDSDGADYRIDAPDLGIDAARCCLQADADHRWRTRWIDIDAVVVERLALVGSILEACAADGVAPTPFRATLDTRAFFADDAGHAKLGLGSSAALTVALAGAIRARDGREMLSPAALIDAHRRIQDGRGSGLDVAASLTGGLIAYRLHDAQPQVEPLAWPTGLAWCCVWSGKSASTTDFLRGLARWREEKTSYYAALMGELGTCSTSALAAVKADNAVAFVDAIAAYADGLARMSAASGLDIVSAEHRHIAAIAAAHDVAYKPCGAGGGDIGIALSTDSGRLQGFRQDLAQAGIQSPGITLDAQGVRVN